MAHQSPRIDYSGPGGHNIDTHDSIDEPAAAKAELRVIEWAEAEAAARALDRLPEAVLSIDASLTCHFANEAAARFGKRWSADFAGQHLFDLFPHLVDTSFEPHIHEALETQKVVEYEELDRQTGTWMWRRFYPSASGVTVVIAESALPRAAPEELASSLDHAKASEKSYRDLLDDIAEGVSETSPSGDVIGVNLAFAKMLGYESPEDLVENVSNSADMYVDPDRRNVVVRALLGSSEAETDIEMRRRDGTSLWVRARAVPRHSPEGELIGIQAIVQDISEHRQSERALHEASDRIETRERSLLAEAVHDDPLQLIVAAILRIDGLQSQLPAASAEALEQIATLLEQAVEQLRQLIVTLEPPDLLGGLGVALLSLADGIFIGTTTHIAVHGPMHVPLKPAAKNNAYRIMREALVNARKHAQADNVVITLKTTLDTVVLCVTDDGVGTESFASGPGHMGMASMRSRAEGEQAELDVNTLPGQGTSVTLSLPRVRDAV